MLEAISCRLFWRESRSLIVFPSDSGGVIIGYGFRMAGWFLFLFSDLDLYTHVDSISEIYI